MADTIERTPVHAGVTGFAGRIRAWIAICMSRGRERLFLSDLDDDRLRDLGLTRRDINRETARWPWDGAERR